MMRTTRNKQTRISYIGSFPPPYGGVTIKNKLIFDVLSESQRIDVLKKPSWMSRQIYQSLNLLSVLLPNQKLIIGVSAAGQKSQRVTRMLYLFARNNMRRSLYFMMGGQERYKIAKDQALIKQYSCYQKIYVETDTMRRCLVEAGMNNVAVFPNCRKRSEQDVRAIRHSGNIRCVFFSIIQPEKGVDLIIDAAKELTDVEFFFYGPIKKEYESEFLSNIHDLNNVRYKGLFTGTDADKYKELSAYDILLLPTRWKNEGVPGILVESKIAGLAEIVSNQNYNAEIVTNKKDGIVLGENTVDCLKAAIRSLADDYQALEAMKYESWLSAKKFLVENYVDEFNIQLGGVTHRDYLMLNPKRLKCVFFSLIQKQKGVDLILEAARICDNVEFSLYGSIDPSYTDEFNAAIKTLPNARYMGVFKGSNFDVYKELAKYDVLLFPTKWETEGVPGILVEGKISGLAEIVSNKSYNAELVCDGVGGIVLEQNDKKQLANAIMLLDRKRDYLEKMKHGSRKSAERFYVDNYIENVKSELEIANK